MKSVRDGLRDHVVFRLDDRLRKHLRSRIGYGIPLRLRLGSRLDDRLCDRLNERLRQPEVALLELGVGVMARNEETNNAKIVLTSFGYEGHGILTFYLFLEGYGWHCGFGGLRADGPGLGDAVKRMLEVVGVDSWEKLKGQLVRDPEKFAAHVGIQEATDFTVALMVEINDRGLRDFGIKKEPLPEGVRKLNAMTLENAKKDSRHSQGAPTRLGTLNRKQRRALAAKARKTRSSKS